MSVLFRKIRILNRPQTAATAILPKNKIKSPIPFIVATCKAFDMSAFHAIPAAGQKLILSIAITVYVL